MRRFIMICFCAVCLFSQKESDADSGVSKKAICVMGQKVDTFPFYVYHDGNSAQQAFFATGLMGDLANANVDLYNKEQPYQGESCVKVVYEKTPDSIGWAGLYWQTPANNWGEAQAGYDLQKAKKLTFWARGAKGGEVINIAQVGGIAGKYGDTGNSAIGPIILSKEWTQYTIDLQHVGFEIMFSKESRECWPFMEPLSRIIGGFGWAASLDANQGQGLTLYLDEIRFERE